MSARLMLCLFIAMLLSIGSVCADESSVQVTGKVIQVLEEHSGEVLDQQRLVVELRGGAHKGRQVEFEHQLIKDGNPAYGLWAKKGDRLLLSILYQDDEPVEIYVVDHQRGHALTILILLFALLLLLIGGRQGLRTLVTLLLTIALVGVVLLPALFHGFAPVPMALAVGIAVAMMTFVIVSGMSRKTLAATVGTLGGLLGAVVMATWFGEWASLHGLSSQDAQLLQFAPNETEYNFKGLLLAGIMIGALGAVMDVAISIASALSELRKATRAGFLQLFRSGMNIGRDIMGTMSNTLILAYAGASLPLLMLLMAYDKPMLEALNTEYLAVEVIRALAGSIGLVLCIPVSALAAAWLLRDRDEQGSH